MDFDKDTVSLMKLHGRILLQGITGGTVLDLVLLGVWYLTGGWQIWGVRFARERMAVWRGWEGKVGMGEVERRCRGGV